VDDSGLTWEKTTNSHPIIAALITARLCSWRDLDDMGMLDIIDLYEIYVIDAYNKAIAAAGKK
jgi:hypothetical protein